MSHSKLSWLPKHSQIYIAEIETKYRHLSLSQLEQTLLELSSENKRIHEEDCINLNPATNVMNPKAELFLADSLGTRPSLGYPGEKYEMGLEAIEKIEVLSNQLVRDVFQAQFAESRLASGALANLYAFMAVCKPGDSIIVPPPEIGGHVTHHQAGAAGLYGLNIHYAPVDVANYSVDTQALSDLAKRLKPKLITVGGSLNLFHHPVKEICDIAASIDARVHFDAAHLSGLIAGGAWPNPLNKGADIMTFSTYKSLGGPAAGALVTNNEAIAKRVDKIAFPGLTANFDVAKTAALAMTLLDWKAYGQEYAKTMVATASGLANALESFGIPVYTTEQGITVSHQFALEATAYQGGQTMAKQLRQANILSSGIGLPIEAVPGDMNGLRLGTPEIVRWGMTEKDMPRIAEFIARALSQNESTQSVASEVKAFREQFNDVHFVRK